MSRSALWSAAYAIAWQRHRGARIWPEGSSLSGGAPMPPRDIARLCEADADACEASAALLGTPAEAAEPHCRERTAILGLAAIGVMDEGERKHAAMWAERLEATGDTEDAEDAAALRRGIALDGAP